MRRSDNFLMQEVAGKNVVVPVGKAAVSFPGMLTLNESGAFLWEQLSREQTEESLLAAMLDRYEVTEEQAQKDIRTFLEKLTVVGAVEK